VLPKAESSGHSVHLQQEASAALTFYRHLHDYRLSGVGQSVLLVLLIAPVVLTGPDPTSLPPRSPEHAACCAALVMTLCGRYP